MVTIPYSKIALDLGSAAIAVQTGEEQFRIETDAVSHAGQAFTAGGVELFLEVDVEKGLLHLLPQPHLLSNGVSSGSEAGLWVDQRVADEADLRPVAVSLCERRA